MPRKKKETLVHFDIDSLSKQPGQKEVVQPVSLGQTLKTKREKKKLSLEDVSKKLCIKELYLKALEEGQYYTFPNRVYGIGFLRSYAKFLGLDSDLMVAEFHAETSDIKDAPLDMPVIEKTRCLAVEKDINSHSVSHPSHHIYMVSYDFSIYNRFIYKIISTSFRSRAITRTGSVRSSN